MRSKRSDRRPHGTGSIAIRSGIYYGRWRIGDRQVHRRLGPARAPGTQDGLTRAMAEAKLRGLMHDFAIPPVAERVTVADAGRRHLVHLTAMGRKPSTLRSYANVLELRIKPSLGATVISQLTREEVEALIAGLARDGLSAKTIHNAIGLLNGICEYAIKHDWATINPCRHAERPQVQESQDIRYLDQGELEAVLRAIDAEDDYGSVHHSIVLAAAMSGLRMGELLALRWLDVDWQAQRIRVRRSIVRGHLGTPKSRRGSRSVPLADRLGGELDRLLA